MAAVALALLLGCGPSEPEKLYKQGEEAWARGEYSLANGLFERLVELYPEDSLADDALMWLGDIHYLFLSRYDQAIMYYRDLVNLYPDSPRKVDARMKLAGIYRGKKNDCKMAVIEYEKVIGYKITPEMAAEAQYRIAACHFQSGDIQQAVIEYGILVAEYPDSEYADDALYGLASSYFALRRCDEAIGFYERVITTGVDDNLVIDSRFGIAACLEETGRLKEAREIFLELMDEHPNRRMVEHRLRGVEGRIKKLGDKRAEGGPEE